MYFSTQVVVGQGECQTLLDYGTCSRPKGPATRISQIKRYPSLDSIILTLTDLGALTQKAGIFSEMMQEHWITLSSEYHHQKPPPWIQPSANSWKSSTKHSKTPGNLGVSFQDLALAFLSETSILITASQLQETWTECFHIQQLGYLPRSSAIE